MEENKTNFEYEEEQKRSMVSFSERNEDGSIMETLGYFENIEGSEQTIDERVDELREIFKRR